MDKSVVVSIIMPIYNAELYLQDSIDSVLNQDFTEWELLLVNDGSKDNSSKICTQYATKDNRIKYFEKENEGVSSARNLGISNARGEYIVFIDSDDILLKDSCSKMLSAIKQNVSLAVFGLQYMLPDNSMLPIRHRLEKGVYKCSEITKLIIDDGTLSGFSFHSVCGAIYKKTMIDALKLKFDTRVKYNEDGLFNTEYVIKGQESIFINYNDIVYCYRVNPNSTTHVVDKDSPNYADNMDYIEKKLSILANVFPSADIELQLKRRKVTLILEQLIALARNGSISVSHIRKSLLDKNISTSFKVLNYDKMGIGKKLFCLAARLHFFFIVSMILKIYCRKRK